MRINGEWLLCLDGDIRPVIRSAILRGDGTWKALKFLVDTGADRSVISADILADASLAELEPDRSVGGIGGIAATVAVETQLRFVRDDGVYIYFRGRFAAFTDIDALDMSILGRDILDTFALIVDRRAEVVAILGGNHRFSIHTPQ